MPEHSPKHSLTRVPTGWVKKINGRTRWVASLKAAPSGEAADRVYERKMSALWAGGPLAAHAAAATPDQAAALLTVRQLVDLFLTRKEARVGAGIQRRTYDEYGEAMLDFRDFLGGDVPVAALTPDDFGRYRARLAERFGVDRLAKFVVLVRSMFKWAAKPPLRLPLPDYGDEFSRPALAEFRRARKLKRERQGTLVYTPEQVRAQLATASPALRAMILLAVNAGFANTDLAELPRAVLDLGTGWIDYARGKTGADRRAKLWPETIKAIRDYQRVRPAPAAERDGGLLFLTRFGHPYVRDKIDDAGERTSTKDQIGMQHLSLLRSLDPAQPELGFRALRHTYRTLAAETGEEMALDLTMGHAPPAEDMRWVYTQSILGEKLERISDHVRFRVLGVKPPAKPPAAPGARGASRSGASRSRPGKGSPVPKAKPVPRGKAKPRRG